MVVVFVIVFVFQQWIGWFGYVRVVVEGGMVGVFVDWFVVIVLFCCLFGLFILYIVIIFNCKDEIGCMFGEFVEMNFFVVDVVCIKFVSMWIFFCVGEWLCEVLYVEWVGVEGVMIVIVVFNVLSDDDVCDFIIDFV